MSANSDYFTDDVSLFYTDRDDCVHRLTLSPFVASQFGYFRCFCSFYQDWGRVEITQLPTVELDDQFDLLVQALVGELRTVVWEQVADVCDYLMHDPPEHVYELVQKHPSLTISEMLCQAPAGLITMPLPNDHYRNLLGLVAARAYYSKSNERGTAPPLSINTECYAIPTYYDGDHVWLDSAATHAAFAMPRNVSTSWNNENKSLRELFEARPPVVPEENTKNRTWPPRASRLKFHTRSFVRIDSASNPLGNLNANERASLDGHVFSNWIETQVLRRCDRHPDGCHPQLCSYMITTSQRVAYLKYLESHEDFDRDAVSIAANNFYPRKNMIFLSDPQEVFSFQTYDPDVQHVIHYEFSRMLNMNKVRFGDVCLTALDRVTLSKTCVDTLNLLFLVEAMFETYRLMAVRPAVTQDRRLFSRLDRIKVFGQCVLFVTQYAPQLYVEEREWAVSVCGYDFWPDPPTLSHTVRLVKKLLPNDLGDSEPQISLCHRYMYISWHARHRDTDPFDKDIREYRDDAAEDDPMDLDLEWPPPNLAVVCSNPIGAATEYGYPFSRYIMNGLPLTEYRFKLESISVDCSFIPLGQRPQEARPQSKTRCVAHYGNLSKGLAKYSIFCVNNFEDDEKVLRDARDEVGRDVWNHGLRFLI